MTQYDGEAQRAWRDRKRTWLNLVKENAGCFRCGEKDPVVLDFHHIDDTKTYNRSRSKAGKMLVWWKLPWSYIATEVQKCIVLCANCHRREEAFLRD